MANTNKPFKCVHTADATAKNVLGGMLHGVIGMFGLGSLVDPLGKSQSAMQNALKKINQQTAADAPAFALKVPQTQQKILEFQQQCSLKLKTMFGDDIAELWYAVEEDHLFLGVLGVLVIIMIFFMLITPRSCSSKGFGCGPLLE